MKKKFSIYASDDDIINNEHKAIKEKKYLQNYQKIYKKKIENIFYLKATYCIFSKHE